MKQKIIIVVFISLSLIAILIKYKLDSDPANKPALILPKGGLTSIEPSPDSKLIAVATEEELLIWSNDLKEQKLSYQYPKIKLTAPPTIFWSPDNKKIVLGLKSEGKKSGWDMDCYLCYIDGGQKTLRLITPNCRSFEWNPDSFHFSIDTKTRSYLGNIDDPLKIKLFAPNIKSRVLIHKWLSNKELIYFLDKGKNSVFGIGDLDGNLNEEIASYQEYAVSNNKNLIAYSYWYQSNGKNKRSVKVYSTKEGKTISFKNIDNIAPNSQTTLVYWSPDDRKIAYKKYSGTKQLTKQLWVTDISSHESTKIFELDIKYADSGFIGGETVKWINNGSGLAFVYSTASLYGEQACYLVTYDFTTKKTSKKRLPIWNIQNINWSSDGTRLYYTNANRNEIYKVDLN